uniref:Uncharacterized protein n=1 Tax=Arundo donax TaxID=35708 RepID=A0A0A9CIL4_ARUDO
MKVLIMFDVKFRFSRYSSCLHYKILVYC